MKEVLVILLLGVLIFGYYLGVKISRDMDKVIRNNKYISNYRRHKDIHVKQLALSFKIKDNMRWREMPDYLRDSDSLVEKIENYLKEKNSKSAQ